MTRPLPSHPFWRHSLRLYARPGVARACLWLQERCGADVNLLLLCCWLESRGRAVDARFLARAAAGVAAWRRDAVEPLRRVRRKLKPGPPGVPPAWCAPVREGAMSAELAAEQVEQLLLARLAARLPRGRARPAEAASNLDRYREQLGVPVRREVERRLDVLRAAGAGE